MEWCHRLVDPPNTVFLRLPMDTLVLDLRIQAGGTFHMMTVNRRSADRACPGYEKPETISTQMDGDAAKMPGWWVSQG